MISVGHHHKVKTVVLQVNVSGIVVEFEIPGRNAVSGPILRIEPVRRRARYSGISRIRPRWGRSPSAASCSVNAMHGDRHAFGGADVISEVDAPNTDGVNAGLEQERVASRENQ